MDFSVSDDQEYVVHFLIFARKNKLFRLLKYRSKVSRSEELHLLRNILVSLNHIFNASDIWLVIASIEREAVTDLLTAHERGGSSESIEGVDLI